MKQVSLILIYFSFIAFHACSPLEDGLLLDGKNKAKWEKNGDVTIENGILSMIGKDAKATFNSGPYKNFILNMEVRTTTGAIGAVWFHTNSKLKKGYSVAINNTREDSSWWKLTGSLLSIRNLTKSLVKDHTWFDMQIKIEGQTITISINDKPVVEYIEPSEPYRIGEFSKRRLSKGVFSFECQGNSEIQFRNMYITILDSPKNKEEIQRQLAKSIDEKTNEIIRLHQEDFPVLDYHIHLKDSLTEDRAAALSRKLGINYAVGYNSPITNDDQIYEYLSEMRSQPFILGMEANGRDWVEHFSKDARNEFDFIFSDAMTSEETWIEDEKEYMDMLVNRICEVLEEPINVYVNPCYLPFPLNKRYDELWTEERMNKVIDALVKNKKALEINETYKIPNKIMILKAKKAGVKFTFGTNNSSDELNQLEYCIQMKKECGLTADDMFKPKIKI